MSDWQTLARRLVAERYDHLVAYAHMVAGSRPDAEDLVQEALVATFSKPRGLADLIVAETYVRRAIMTRFIDSKRKGTRDARTAAALGEATARFTPGHERRSVDSLDLTAALSQLPPRERACVVLRYLEHLSVAETARVLDLAEGSVKRYVSDGIARLNSILDTSDNADDLTSVRPAGTGGAR